MLKEKSKKLLYFYKKYFKKFFWLQIINNSLAIILVVLSLLQPILDKKLIDDVITNRHTNIFIKLLIAYAVLTCAMVVIKLITQRIGVNIDKKTNFDLKSSIINNIQSYSRFDVSKKSDVVLTLSNDTIKIKQLFNNTIWSFMLSMFNIIFVLMVLFKESVILTAVLLIDSILQLYLVNYYSSKFKINIDRSRNNSERQFRFFDSTLVNFRIIKCFTNEIYNFKKYKNLLNEENNIKESNYRISKQQTVMMAVVSVICTLLSIYIGVNCVLKDLITLGTYTLFLNYSSRLKSSFSTILDTVRSYKTIDISLNRAYLYCNGDNSTEILTKSNKVELNNIDEIKLNNVSFKYSDKFVLQDYNYCFTKGNIYFILGKNGCGKSTLVELLINNLNATKGEILINEENIEILKDEPLRKMFSVAFQQEYFLEDTILNNITMCNNEVNQDKLKYILEFTGCNTIIEKLTNGIHTSMNEIENEFSTGELQKFNIARALLKDADVYILDEAFSNIDYKSKINILSELHNYLKNKIVLIITHDSEIIDRFDDFEKVNLSQESCIKEQIYY